MRGHNLYGKEQKVLSKQGWENWDKIFGKKGSCGCGDESKCECEDCKKKGK